MPACRHCGADHPAEELDRHQHGGRVVVRCPDCKCVMGTWWDRSVGHPPAG